MLSMYEIEIYDENHCRPATFMVNSRSEIEKLELDLENTDYVVVKLNGHCVGSEIEYVSDLIHFIEEEEV